MDTIITDINKFIKLKQISGTREDKYDIGWFTKSNEILNIDFDESDRNVKLSELLDDSRTLDNQKAL